MVGIVLLVSDVRIAEQIASVLFFVCLLRGLQSRVLQDLSVSAGRADCKVECTITIACEFLMRKAGQSQSYENRFFVARCDAENVRSSAYPQLAFKSEDESYTEKVRRNAYPQLSSASEDRWNAENVCKSAKVHVSEL